MTGLLIGSSEHLPRARSRLPQAVTWWLLFLVCALFSIYSFYVGTVEVLALSGLAEIEHARSVPPVFIVHTFIGGTALLCGPLQFNQTILRTNRRLHRIPGRIYVWTVWVTSVSGLWLAIYFDVTVIAKIAFAAAAAIWFGTTGVGYMRIRQKKVAEHREWMIRSFALTFAFVTFTLWVEAVAILNLPETAGYPLTILLNWGTNLSCAEWWILRTRKGP